MSILPKCLYIFQSIPLAPPPPFFSKIRKLLSKCIWNNRKPRLEAAVAQSVGTWSWNRRVAGSRPDRTKKSEWAGSWRGASSPPRPLQRCPWARHLTSKLLPWHWVPGSLSALPPLLSACVCACISSPVCAMCVNTTEWGKKCPCKGLIKYVFFLSFQSIYLK